MIRPCDMMVVAMSRLIGDGDTVFHGDHYWFYPFLSENIF